jgi:VanZ family protein
LSASGLLLAVYLSLIPFEFRPVPLHDAFELFASALTTPPLRPSRGDFMANALFFSLVGFVFSGALGADHGRWARLARAFVASVSVLCLSVVLEFTQVFFAGRVSSGLDVLADGIGGAVGAFLWPILGQAWLAGQRVRASKLDRKGWLIWLSRLYVGWFVLAGLVPFDVTLDLGELAAKYRSGRIALIPFSHGPSWGAAIVGGVLSLLQATPLGLLGTATSRRTARLGRLGSGLAYGSVVVVAVEVAQVFLLSRWADATDVVLGAGGVAVGSVLAFLLLPLDDRKPSAVSSEGDWRRHCLAAALALWAMTVVAYHWYPFQFVVSPVFLSARLHGLSWLPLVGYYRSAPFTALDEVATKFGLAIPLGVLAGRYFLLRSRAPAVVVTTAMVSLAFFGGIEAGQVLIPVRVPDLGDVLVGVVGVVGGVVLAGTCCPSLTKDQARPSLR